MLIGNGDADSPLDDNFADFAVICNKVLESIKTLALALLGLIAEEDAILVKAGDVFALQFRQNLLFDLWLPG